MDNKNLTLEQARLMTDAERMDYLCDYWELNRNQPTVYGTLKKGGFTLDSLQKWLIHDVRNPSGKFISYPKSVINRDLEIFLDAKPIKSNLSEGDRVEIEIALATEFERERQKNPFSLCAKWRAFKPLNYVSSMFVAQDEIGGIFLEQTIYEQIVSQIESRIASLQIQRTQLEQAVEGLEKQKAEFADYTLKVKTLRIEQIDREKKLQKLTALLDETQIKLEGLTAQTNQKQQQLEKLSVELDSLTTQTTTLTAEKNLLEQSKKSLEDKIAALKKDEDDLVNKTEQLREIAKYHAKRLYELEFIDIEQYNDIRGIPKEREKPTGEELLFDGPQLEGNFKKLAQYLQIYLFERKNIMYPQYLLKDFLTLLRTHDFIILSGLSGAGKTLLVKAVAAALGGVAKIVPVKPNWTSSEDLLGYYNPLQKAYLSTPFLDALVEAKRNPQQLYLICLDEMNLARVEYYFADFLSALEEREKVPEIKLYSHEESGNVLAEFHILLTVLKDAWDKSEKPLAFGELLTNEELNQKLQSRMGTNDNESFAQLYSRLQRMVSQLLNIPPTLEVPANVRIIGAINVDQTTNSLSPKVIDRAHIIQFQSPFKYGDEIEKEVKQSQTALSFADYSKPVYLHPQVLGEREDYPSYSEHRNNEFVQTLVTWITRYFEPLGIDVGFRTIRQALNYQELAKDMDDDKIDVLNSLMLYKILPRFSFEGNREVKMSESSFSRHALVGDFCLRLEDKLKMLTKRNEVLPRPRAYEKLLELWEKAESSDDKLYNYWS